MTADWTDLLADARRDVGESALQVPRWRVARTLLLERVRDGWCGHVWHTRASAHVPGPGEVAGVLLGAILVNWRARLDPDDPHTARVLVITGGCLAALDQPAHRAVRPPTRHAATWDRLAPEQVLGFWRQAGFVLAPEGVRDGRVTR